MKEFLKRRKSIESEGEPIILNRESPSLHGFSSLKTPKTLNNHSTQEKKHKFLSDPFEDREKKIKTYFSNKVMGIKKNLDLKKSKQLKKLRQIESEREKKNNKLLERLQKHEVSFRERSSKSYENFLKKSQKIKNLHANYEKMHEDYIQETLNRHLVQQQEIKLKIKEDLALKSEKAKSMSRNLIAEKKMTEDEKLEHDFNKFIKKLEKNKEKKHEIDQAMKFHMGLKQKREKMKEIEVKKKIAKQEKELQQKIEKYKKLTYRSMEKVIQEKNEKYREKLLRNELGSLYVQTRISRINSKNVNFNQNLYKLKLFEDHVAMVKRLNDIQSQKKGLLQK